VSFGKLPIKDAIEIGKEAAEFISGYFPSPVKLKFEKVYKPFLLIAKKNYAGLPWKHHTHSDPIEAKGLEAIRRDACPLVKTVY